MSKNTILRPASADSAAVAQDVDEEVVSFPGDARTAEHRARLYLLISLAFERPGDDFAAALADNAFNEQLQESAAVLGGDLPAAAERVRDALADREQHHGEWASLFGVEEGMTVSPYELRYLPGPLLTTIRKLADIRGFYNAYGLAITDGMNDRPDHICFLTEFLGYLANQEAYLRRHEDDDGVRVVVETQRSFLEDHLGRWYWRFAEEVANQDTGTFYSAMADLLAALVEAEIDRLAIDPDWVPDDPAVLEWSADVFGDVGRGCGPCGMNPGEDEQLMEGMHPGHGHLIGDESPDSE